MVKKTKVLLYPANNPIAINVYKSLIDTVLFMPYAATSKPDFDKEIFSNYIEGIPFIFENNFVETLNRKLKENDIKYIIPLHDTVALKLKELEGKINAEIVCSPLETCEICRHKIKTYKIFKDTDIVPKVYANADEIDEFPVFIKDDIGQGGQNSYLIHNKKELEEVLENTKIKFVITEYLPGKETTVDCFTDKKGGLVVASPRVRKATFDGKCSNGETTVLTEEIYHIAKVINDKMKLRGGWFFQVKEDKNGKNRLMEVSVRLAGTHGISRQLDLNFAALSLYDRLGYENLIAIPNQCVVKQVKVLEDRYKIEYDYDTVYFDFDDTLVVNKQTYIPLTFAYLLQLKNKGVKVILITRHDTDIFETLSKVHIDKDIFDEIIQVEEGKEKYEYIDMSRKCIFIDNSFNERIKVKEYLGIPTFDVSNVESLYDFYN